MQRKMKRRWRRELKQKVVRYILPAVAAAGIMLSSYNLCLAAPKGGTVTAGDGNISSSGNTTTITQSSDKLIIGWQSFDIGSGEKIVFVQPGSNAIALNRVLGSDATSIYGTLTANGRVFLINPNGILFSSTAHVDVGGLVASTLNISDTDFLSDNYIFSGDGAAVVNQGTITASDGGYIVLLGSQASNEGIVVAQQGTVALGAGKQVTLDFYGDGLLNLAVDQGALGALAENRNLIQADGGRVIMTARAADALAGTVVNNTGIVQARSIESKNGVIILDGGTNGTVNNNGTLDAGGGHVETSGGGLSLSGTVKAGDWLIDPTDITIDTTGAGTIADTLNGGGDVTIKTDAAADGNGDIFVDSPISWSTDRTLTLTAYRNVNVNADITATGNNAGLVVTPDNTHTGIGSYSLGNGTAITLSGATPSLSIAGQTYIVVNTLTGLQNVNNDLGNCYALGSNIDATGTQTWNSDGSGNYEGFVPIGTNTIFTGTFDGLGHTISGLYINRPSTDYVGLFGYSQGTIKNLGLEDGRITGNFFVGGLVGYNRAYNDVIGQITNSYNTGAVNGVGGIAGGLVGRNDGTIANSYNTGMVSGNREIGGLVGVNNNDYSSQLFTGSITNCYNTGAVSGGTFIGGLTSSNLGNITDSYNEGAVNGSSFNVGGLAGRNYGTIANSYNNASVWGDGTEVGGLAGDNYGSIKNSHNTGEAGSGSYRIGGLAGNNVGSIMNSYNAGPVSSVSGFAGGLAGENHGSIDGSYNTGEMADGTSVVGGLVGYNHGGSIAASYNTGTVNGTSTIGGLVGWNEDGGGISGSYNSGAVNSSDSFCGGLVGWDGDSAGVGDYIVNSYNTGAVNGSDVYVGGLIGYNQGSSIKNSYNAGPVNGTHDVGGLVGFNYDNITNSYNTGAVSGISDIGGLVGYNISSGSIANSYNTGRVSGEPYRRVGGLVGFSEKEGAITNSYWDIETSGIRIGVGNDASYKSFGRTTAAMMSLSNYPQGSSEWDFADTWGIIHGVSYPYLKSIYTETPQVVSGTLSSGTGGQAIRTFVNGTALDNATTGANGFYYMLLANGTIADHDAVLAYVDNGSVSGNAIYGVSGVNTSVAGLNITVGAVNVYGNSASPGLTDLLATAKGSLAGNAILYSGSNTEANVVGDLHVIGPSGIGGNITASGSQIYSGAVTLNSDSTMTGSSITFESTVDGTYNLTIIGNGGFTGNIGGATALAGLSVSGITGAGGNVTTTGTQRYGDAVMLNSDSVLKGSIVIFTSSVDGAFNLAIDGNADINGKIGDMTALAGLTVNGLTGVGGDISTTGTQIYHGAVTLNNNSIMAGSNVTFTDTVDGAYYLVVQSDSAFNGDVGGRTPLARLEITGTTDIGGDVNTTVGQRYGGPVRLHKTGTTVMNGMDGRVIFKETLDGNGDLTVIAGDGVTIEGNVKTVGAQTYNGPLNVNVGANALSLSGSRLSANSTVTTNNGGRWLAYAPDDGAITGGFMSDYNFTQYGSAYGSAALGDGNGLIYAESLTFNQSLTGVVTKTYDGTTGVDNLTAVNYQIDGPAGFTVSVVSASAHGVYGDKNVNSSNTPLLVTANAAPILSVLDSNGKPVHGFGLSTITASGYIGQITARPLTATQTGTVKKTYDGNAAAIFDGTNITLAGIVDGDSVHVSGVGTYDGKNAGTRNVTVDSVTIDNDNYSLAAADVAGGTLTGQIDRRALTAAQNETVKKTYDGNTAAIFDGTNITLAGIVDGDSVSVVSGVGMYDGKNSGTHNVTVDSVVLDNGNYSLAAADVAGGTLTGQIDRRTLTGIQSGTVKKTYDGNTAAIFDGTNITLAGIVDGDSVSVVNGVGTYDSKNAGTRNVTVDSVTIDNDNYSLAVADVAGGTLTGQIDRRALTITASSQNKIYDGAMNAVVNYGSDQVSGDDLIIAGTAVFADKNVGVGKNVSVTGINISGQDAGNYYLVNTSVTGVTADIGKAVLTISANNLTKDVGTSNPPFSVTCTGFAAGDSIAALDGTLALTTPATTDSLVGRYVITPSGVSSANYEIIFVEGVLVVQIPVPMSDAIVAAYRTMENGIYPTPWVSRLVGYHDGISDPLIDIIENGINTEFSGNGGGIEESGESDG